MLAVRKLLVRHADDAAGGTWNDGFVAFDRLRGRQRATREFDSMCDLDLIPDNVGHGWTVRRAVC